MKLPENVKLGRGGGYGRQAGAKFLSPFSRRHSEHEHLCPICITQPSPQGPEMNSGRKVFLSFCAFQRQMRYSFFFSLNEYQGITWAPKTSMNSKHWLWHFFRFGLPNIFFWLASHKCLLLRWSVINHHILTITGVNSLSPLCCNWAASLKASLLLPSTSQEQIIYSGTINAECKPGPCVMEGSHP